MKQQGVLTPILITLLFFWGVIPSKAQNLPSPLKPIDEIRVREIEKMLPDAPAGFGEPYSNRTEWNKLLATGKYDSFLKQMETFEFPAFSKDDYFSLSNGTAPSSARGLQMMRDRAKGLSQVTWAECLENKGRYLKRIEEGLTDILEQKSWVSPRNDFDFKNYNGVEYSVELTSALYAHTIAQSLYLLGDKLGSKLRVQAIEALQKRVFEPVLNKISTQNNARENRFLEMTNNYNHVCLSGVVGAALAVLQDKKQRAIFTYIGEYYSKNGLEGFGNDGYCSEGVVYYNYGFGHYVVLRENIWQASQGQVDLFAIDKVKKIAHYVPRLEVINGVFPSISDSKPGVQPDPAIMNYISRNFGLGLSQYDTLTFEGKTDDNRSNVMMVFPNSSSKREPKKVIAHENEILRSFFEETGVLVTRPMPGTACDIGVAFKGGNNKEHHNHNDLGSYSVISGKEIMAGDPGSIPYTSDIFDEKFRYTYKSIGSYGHPVPLVAKTEQKAGIQSKASVIHTSFNQNEDTMVLDISTAYPNTQLTKLERTMTFNRKDIGKVTITDDFAFSQPRDFETALITRADWVKKGANSVLLTIGKEKMLVTFSSPGHKLALRSEKISEGGAPYSRIGIYMDEPALTGKIVVTYLPVP